MTPDGREMTRIRVDSSSIASVGYLPDQRLMEVEFVTGRLYAYEEVPETVFRELLAAESVGRYFSAHVRPAGYRYQKIA